MCSRKQITMSEYDKLFEIKDDKKRNEVLKSIGTNNFNNEILRAVQAEKTTEIRKKFFEDLNEYAEEVKDTTGLVYIGWFDNTKNITDYSIPECTKLYYRS